MSVPVSLQLYTLRDECEKDYIGVLKRVAEVGCSAVELAGCPLGAGELRRVVSDLGLAISGGHASPEELETNIQEVIDFHLSVGSRFVILPYLEEERRSSADGWRRCAEAMNVFGAACQEHGLTFCYHNHSFEFESFGGQTGYEILMEDTDPALVRCEVDTYWVQHGGLDPAAFLKTYRGRCPLLHIKDMSSGADQAFAEVGNGILNWESIFAAAEEFGGVEWYIVEQDECPGPPIDSVTLSFQNLKKMNRL